MSAGDQDNGQFAGQIGQILERKRLEKGLSLKEVEHATKIRTRYLEGLEREDPTVLPDPIYARGFLKTYANFLGLDGESLSRELKDRRAPRRERQFDYQSSSRVSEADAPLITPGGVGGAERRRISGATVLIFALAALVLAGVIGSLYYVGSRSAGSGGDDAAQGPVAEQEEPPDPTPPQGEEPTTETTNGTGANDTGSSSPADDEDGSDEDAAATETVPMTVSVSGGSTGMTLSVDGAVVYDGVAQTGFSQTFEARRVLTVSARNGGIVEVEADGRNLGRAGNPGQPVTRDFPVQPAG